MAYLQSDNVVVLSNIPPSICFKPESSTLLLVDNSSNDSWPPLARALTLRKIVHDAKDIQVINNSTDITKSSLKKCFVNLASKHNDGERLFIFSYTGPAVELSNDCSLRMADFERDNPVTHVTSTTLLEWLSEACTSQPVGNALILFNCPFAHRITSHLTSVSSSTTPLNTQLFTVATEIDDTPLILTTLKNQTIFQYFLSWVISSTELTPGVIPLRSMLKKVASCTTALSTLIVQYHTKDHVLKPSTIEPNIGFIQRIVTSRVEPQGTDETDSFSGLEFLTCHFDRKKSRSHLNLDQKVYRWLDSICDVKNDENPLKLLYENGTLDNPNSILPTVICAMMYSIASIQIAQGNGEGMKEPNLFIIAFVSIVSTIQIVYREQVDDLLQICKQSWEFYHHVVKENKVDDSKLKMFYHKITRLETRA